MLHPLPPLLYAEVPLFAINLRWLRGYLAAVITGHVTPVDDQKRVRCEKRKAAAAVVPPSSSSSFAFCGFGLLLVGAPRCSAMK